MFYIANLILSMGIQRLSEFLDDYLGYYSYDLKLLWTGLLLVAVGLFFIVYKWDKPHKHYTFWRVIAYIMFLAGFGNLIDTDFYAGDHYYNSYLAQIVFSLSYFIPGLLIYFRNRKLKTIPESITPPEVTTIPNEEIINSGTDIDRLRAKLKQASETQLAQNNSKFYENLADSNEILREIQNEDYKIDHNFLEQIAKLTDFYLDLEDNKFQTEQSKKTLNEIVNTFDTIKEALSNIYDQNFSQDDLDIETDIITMKARLNMSGALDSPFDKFKRKNDVNNS